MSKNFAVLRKGSSVEAPFYSRTTNSESQSDSGAYAELLRRFFHVPSAIAIVGCHPGESVAAIVDDIAVELAGLGKRVLLVTVENLLRMKPITVPDDMFCVSSGAGNVWVWPARGAQPVEFFTSRGRVETGDWLDLLRRTFDAVLLDCTGVESLHATAEVAAMANATVICVEAQYTTAQQVTSTQYALQSKGALLAGTILIRRGHICEK